MQILLNFLSSNKQKSNKQRAKSKERQAKTDEQRAKTNKKRATSKRFHVDILIWSKLELLSLRGNNLETTISDGFELKVPSMDRKNLMPFLNLLSKFYK